MSALPRTECPLAVDRIKDPIGLRQFGRTTDFFITQCDECCDKDLCSKPIKQAKINRLSVLHIERSEGKQIHVAAISIFYFAVSAWSISTQGWDVTTSGLQNRCQQYWNSMSTFCCHRHVISHQFAGLHQNWNMADKFRMSHSFSRMPVMTPQSTSGFWFGDITHLHWPVHCHWHVILHWPTKFRPNWTIRGWAS